MEQFFPFALKHLAYRYACPTAYNVCNIFSCDFFLDHGFATLGLFQLFLYATDFIFKRFQLAIADFGNLTIVTFPFGAFSFKFQLFHLLLVLLDLVDQTTFSLPFGFIVAFLFFQFGYFLVQLFQFGLVVFALDGFTFYFKLFEPSFNLIEFFWDGITLHTQFGCSFIHQVNGFVRKETVCDISVGQFHGSDDGIILNTYLVMVFITFFQTTQD